MKTPKPSDAPRGLRLPREILTAEQGFWTAARVPRVATLADDPESSPSARGRRRGVSIVTRALRQVVALLFGLVMFLVVSGSVSVP
jgi:hypothetical protein